MKSPCGSTLRAEPNRDIEARDFWFEGTLRNRSFLGQRAGLKMRLGCLALKLVHYSGLNLAKSVDEMQVQEAVNKVIRPGLRHYSGEQETTCPQIVAKFYFMLRRAATDGKISDEISAFTSTYEKSLEVLDLWSELVIERNATIARHIIKIKHLRKQRKLLIYTIVLIIAIFSVVSTYILGLHTWFRIN